MELNPEVVAAYKTILTDPAAYGINCRPITDCFETTQTVTAKHLLAADYIAETHGRLPKVICYILMDELFGPCNGKDDNGNLGYSLKFKINEKL